MSSPTESSSASPLEFVVGIGASAGGLEPLERFFAEMSPTSGVAFVVVQHLSPSFKSLMVELLARHTDMPIYRVEEGMSLESDSIYLIPPNMEMTVRGGQLHLTQQERSTSAPQLPIDAFFHSLAADFGLHAIGIIMSGTGSDGSRGIRSIKEVGGLTVAQDHASAKFDGMPRSSIDTGAVDRILSPEEMASAVLAYCKDPKGFKGNEDLEVAGGGFESILKTLRDETELDFTQYKPSTVRRRIERRVEMGKVESLDEYAELIGDDTEEVHNLYKDLLIGVTRFFRDREAFRRLEEAVIPELFKKETLESDEIRVWVAGCATGEEAYSLAILFHEYAATLPSPPRIRIFATDAHRTSLEVASAGRYDKHILTGVTPRRLEAYFKAVGDEYQVNPELRQMITFAPHNLLQDAPFMRVDLVTCRNLLIYFQIPAQMQVLHVFHFALRVGGVLFLGPSETVGTLKPEFTSIDNHWRIYRKRRDVRLTSENQLPATIASRRARPVPLNANLPSSLTPDRHLMRAYDVLLDTYVPGGVLVNERREIVHTFGRGRTFLQPPVGRITLDVLELVDPAFKVALGSALQRSSSDRDSVRYRHIEAEVPSSAEADAQAPSLFELFVQPIGQPTGGADVPYFLVTVEPEQEKSMPRVSEVAMSAKDQNFDASIEAQNKIRALEHELRHTNESLQATIEELETSNEELNAANEELIASNEELQSTNEELHSVNEELYTVNSEYQHKITELMELTDDVSNLLSSTDIAVVFLDRELCIRRFTPAASIHFRLREQDISRPLSEINHSLEDAGILNDVHRVLETESEIQREIRSEINTAILLRVLPYTTSSGEVDGVVIALIDTSLVYEARRDLETITARFEAFMDYSPTIQWALDESGNYIFTNAAYRQVLQVHEANCIGQSPRSVLAPQTFEALAGQAKVSGQTLTVGGRPASFEVQVPVGKTVHDFYMTEFVFEDSFGQRLSGGAGVDITELKKVTNERDLGRERFELAMRSAGCGLWEWRVDTGEAVYDERFYTMLGYSPGDFPMTIKGWESIVHPDELDSAGQLVASLLEGDLKNYRAQHRVKRKDGTWTWVVSVGEITARDAGDKPVRVTGVHMDIEDLKQAEFALEDLNSNLMANNSELAARNHELDQFAHAASHDLRSPLRSVVGFAEIVRESLGEGAIDQAERTLRRIDEAALRMGNLIDSLLMFASVGRGQLLVDDVSLNRIFENVIKDLAPEIESQGAVLLVDDDLPTLEGDATLLHQVFQNLVANSIKYRGPDTPTIAVSATPLGDLVSLTIADNGIGFDPAEADRAFAPFQRLHSGHASRGSGIGLSICRRVVERHGGTIEVETEVGKGSRFTVKLPTRQEGVEA